MITLAASILVKIYPLGMVRFFLPRVRVKYWCLLPTVVCLAYLPYSSAGLKLFDALLYYKDKWRFNGFLFGILSQKLESEWAAERILLAMIVALLAGLLIRTGDLIKQLYWMTGAILLAAPTMFPWYLIWLAPYLCFFPNLGWLLLMATCSLSYHILIPWGTLGGWQQDTFFQALEYYPFFGVMLGLLIEKTWRRNNAGVNC